MQIRVPSGKAAAMIIICRVLSKTFLSTAHLNDKRCYITLIVFEYEKLSNYANPRRNISLGTAEKVFIGKHDDVIM